MKDDFPSSIAVAAAAWMLDCQEAAIRAVATVEASTEGAFMGTGEPTILFERHVFNRLTNGRFTQEHSAISFPAPGGYGRYSIQHARLRQAAELDREAALMSASWGLYQLLGENWRRCGFHSLQHFINAMYSDVDAHLRAFVFFLYSDDELVGALRRLDWDAFGLRYNGPAYRRHQYDTRLAAAHRQALEGRLA